MYKAYRHELQKNTSQCYNLILLIHEKRCFEKDISPHWQVLAQSEGPLPL